MPFKKLEDVLKIDPRFVGICTMRDGMPAQTEFAELHARIAEIQLGSSAPVDIKTALERARSILLYAYFDLVRDKPGRLGRGRIARTA